MMASEPLDTVEAPDQVPGETKYRRPFQVEVLTPGGRLCSMEAESAVFPASDGLVGVLGGRGPMVALVGAGPLNIREHRGEMHEFYVAGGFGRYLNLENAVTLGLLPDIPRERFIYLGNTSLKGSALALLSKGYRDLMHDMASKMTYLNLSNEAAYMDHYTAALFMPHTDRTRFPSVK